MLEDLVITDDQEVIDWCNHHAPAMIDLFNNFWIAHRGELFARFFKLEHEKGVKQTPLKKELR